MVMLTPATIEEVKMYQQIRTPDVAALANYVTKAKGAERTMAQFAEDTQIGASTLSRIVNLNIKKPLSMEMIITIYENRENSGDQYLLDSLARANGMFPPDYAEKVKDESSIQARRNAEVNREHLMKNAIIAGVVAAGVQINQVMDRMRIRRDDDPLSVYQRRGTFCLDIDSKSNTRTVKSWMFFLYPQIFDESDVQRHRTPRSEIRWLMDRINGLFLIDAWQPEALVGQKTSFAFVDEGLFEAFKEMYSVARLHTEMTILLLDQTTFAVIKEVWIPGEYEQLSNISVFEAPAPVADDEEYDDYGKFYNYEKTEDTE